VAANPGHPAQAYTFNELLGTVKSVFARSHRRPSADCTFQANPTAWIFVFKRDVRLGNRRFKQPRNAEPLRFAPLGDGARALARSNVASHIRLVKRPARWLEHIEAA